MKESGLYSAGTQRLLTVKVVGKSYLHPREGSDRSEENGLEGGRGLLPLTSLD